MSGQGCPFSFFRFCANIVFAYALSHALLVPQVDARVQENSSSQSASAIQTQLRISWGGGQAQTWTGKIAIVGKDASERFHEVTPIALTADASASVRKVGEELVIDHWSPTDYGGVDVKFQGRTDTKIRIILSSVEDPQIAFEKIATITELLNGVVGGEIDAFGNRCSVTRAPGDLLEFEFEKDHLVFRPGEDFRFSVRPNYTGLTTRTSNCKVRVQPNLTNSVGRSLFSKTAAITLDENGSSENSTAFEMQVPQQEGIYNVLIELEPVWYQASFNNKKKTIRRNIQFIVLAQRTPALVNQRRWRQVSVADSVVPNGRLALPGWDQFSRIARLQSRVPLGNELRMQVTYDQQQMMALAPGGWQAVPVDVDRLNRPHVIELEYVADGEMALGLSVLQPDANGQVSLYGFDSGVHIPSSIVTQLADNQSDQAGQTQRHRLTVWPKTKSPYLLIANRHADRSATIGKIRVFAGPDRLEPSSVAEVSAKSNRKLMAFYEAPLFPENFGADKTIDPSFGEPLDDWRMFYQGTARLIEYLKANSYRGAFITVACDGSSIYPSSLLKSSPKHDNGRFFVHGQDPVQKDILEMMFRMFEREGLLMVPSLALSGPLPEVEESRVVAEAPDFELVDLNLVSRKRQVGGGLPIYNPLDRQVQRSVTRVVEELAERYKSYSSFQGIAIVCRPDTYTLLPGRQWGYDKSTIQQFLQTQNDEQLKPIAGASTAQIIHNVLLGTSRKQWTQWRALQMKLWYRSMMEAMKKSIPEGTLYLAPVDLYRNEETASALSPSLHGSNEYQQAMLHMGFDLAPKENNSADEGIVLLNPHRIAPDQTLQSRRVDETIENSTQAKAFFKNASYAGDLFTHRVSWAHFAQLQEQGPFGGQTSPLMRLQQMAPADQFNRQRFAQAIKDRDARMLIDGGWMLTMGQESSMLDMMSVFNRLPDKSFSDVTTSAHGKTNPDSLPIAVRQLKTGAGNFFYAVNASPWPVGLVLQFKVNSDSESPDVFSLAQPDVFRKFSVSAVKPNNTGESKTSVFEITTEVPAYGLIGGKSQDHSFGVSDYSFKLPEGADKMLKKRVYALQAKLIKSASPPAMPVIENPDFESFGRPTLNSWNTGEQATGKVRLDSRPNLPLAPGQTAPGCLVMNNTDQAPAWIRSNPFEGPTTGRLSISVWLRTDDPAKQPPLRLAVEGQSGETSYYRFGSVGSLSPDPNTNQVTVQWKRFAVHFDDIPSNGLSNVRVGFDLMGPGQVNIDKIEVFDRWFDENDAKAITQILASAGPLLSNQETFDSCRRLLSGYWPQFLDRYASDSEQEPVFKEERPIDFSKIGEPDELVSPIPEEYSQRNRRTPMFRRFRNLTPRKTPQR